MGSVLDFDPDSTATGPYLDVTPPATAPPDTAATVPRWHGGAPVYDGGRRVCGAMACNAAHFARGRCRRHYQRLRRKGIL